MQSDAVYKQLFYAFSDGVVVSDASGKITHWNPAAERIFGYSENEALGQSLDLIIPEKQRERHWDGYHKTMQTGHTRYATDVLQVPAINKNGERISIAFTVGLLYATNNEITGIVAVIRDDTARFMKERGLRSRIEELEKEKGRH